MTTFYYSNPICLEHLVPAGHPERPDRMKALEAVFEHEHFNTLVRHLAPEAAAESVLLAHPESYLAKIRAAIPETGFSRIDSDTTASPRSMEAALISVGGAMAAVDAVFRKEADNAFVATRPPGHHAEKTTSMGFCLFNQAAIAARHAQKAYGAERVAIIDWDVHHGNGTQDIFYDDPSVIYCSTHQMPLYPGTGALRETGKGNIFNAPLSANDGSDHFREAFKTRILPALEETRPDLIIISAGFDAHHRDPLAEINLVADDFDWATGKLMDIAGRYSDNRVVSLLEGGYDLVGLAESAAAHVIRLQEG
ncbi:histone deacetylase family protein [Hoeflea alexandrii]|uniref:Histone deacetylase family protein n=1 Tax=Hoeflea alexandrii TaxID=288436 RepID=A0ABT1CW68_9HYPH|nr:histone deacetylase family protein [Hoeflea alexandrii]MCO6409596.1 histone deacetylase family protein [Hoeflea alexandrii]